MHTKIWANVARQWGNFNPPPNISIYLHFLLLWAKVNLCQINYQVSGKQLKQFWG